MFWQWFWMDFNFSNSGEVVTQAGCEQCGLNAIMPPVATICEQCGLKSQDHVPYPSNDEKMSLTECFRRVLTMLVDAFRFLEFCGSEKPPSQGVGCEQCGLRRKLLGPGLGGSCTPPHKLLKSVANDAFSIGFDDGLDGFQFLEF